jgi:AraC-like DNA-binding protein
MRANDNHLSETDIWPKRAKVSLVRATNTDRRQWFAQAPVCPALTHFQIRHTAVAAMPTPFEIVRKQLSGSYFLACFSGAGRVLVDGRWLACRADHATLLPPGTLQAFHAVAGKPWEFAWVRYQEAPGQRPLATAQTPIIARYDAEPLRLAILGLHRECQTAAVPAALAAWAALIHQYVLRFAQPAELDARLWRLWEQVSASLEQAWSLETMSHETHLSEKQLQRLCQQQLGRTPRQQLMWLRMRRAASLLTETNLKIETIAARVGYANPFVFSATFKRIMGWSPSEYPGRRASK